MTILRRMIYHVPFSLNPEAQSASGIRPLKMLNAFKEIGYDVDVIAGDAASRKVAIANVKRKISEGNKYDFCYSESSTQPTLHTEKYGFIRHPFFEFDFFKFLKKHEISIGLFYRDIYWVFPENLDTTKKKLYKYLYLYDLKQYNKYVDVLFVPSLQMMDYVNTPYKYNLVELPPGCIVEHRDDTSVVRSDVINLIYVGGIGNHYNLKMVLSVLADFPNIHLTLCCRTSDWAKVKDEYIPLVSSNISVIHISGDELKKLYCKSHAAILFVEPGPYWSFAMPYKLFEYIGQGLPVISAVGTKTGDFVSNNNCGFTIEYTECAMRAFLSNLTVDKLIKTGKDVVSLAPSHTWEARARLVAETLSK